MNFRPRVITANGFTHITFGYIIPQDDDELLQFHVEEYLEVVHELYCNRYAKVRPIAGSVRRIDYNAVSAMIIDAYNALKATYAEAGEGDVELCIELRLQHTTRPDEVGQEDISYTLHWHSEQADDIRHITPLGYQLYHSFFDGKEGSVSRLVFDGRVTNRDLQGSYEFYVHQCLPNLDPYFDYLESYFLHVSKNEYNVNVSDIRDTLKQTLVDYFERRLNNPSDTKRQIFFLDTLVVGGKDPNERIIKYSLVMRSDETLTPEYGYDHPKHKFKRTENNIVLKTFASTRTTPIVEQSIDIGVSAHPLEDDSASQHTPN